MRDPSTVQMGRAEARNSSAMHLRKVTRLVYTLGPLVTLGAGLASTATPLSPSMVHLCINAFSTINGPLSPL